MIKLERLPYDLTVCKISSAADAPLETDFFFLEKTDEELSLVCEMITSIIMIMTTNTIIITGIITMRQWRTLKL